MKKFLTTGLVLGLIAFTTAAQANMYKMKMELTVDGKIVARPTVVAAEGQKAVVTEKPDGQSKGFYIEVVAGEADKKKILMKFVVGSDENGVRTVLGSPEVIAKEKKGATVSVTKSDGSESMSLKVWAERVKK